MLACCYSNSPPLCRRCLDVGADKRTFKADFSLSECYVERERDRRVLVFNSSRSLFCIVSATSEGILNGLCIKNLPSLQFCAAHFRRLVLFGLKSRLFTRTHTNTQSACVHMMYLRREILFNSICCYHALLHRLGPVMNRLCTRSSLSRRL